MPDFSYHSKAQRCAIIEGRIDSPAHRRLHAHRRRLQGGRKLNAFDVKLILVAHIDSKGRLHCALCGKVIKGVYHLDHFIPLNKGGTNDLGNYRVTHPKCNQSKGARSPHEIGLLI